MSVLASANDELLGQRSDLQGLRASSLARCARRAAYEHYGAERDERRYFSKGALERGIYMGQAMARYDADRQAALGYATELELAVPWPSWAVPPLGTGHVDVYRVDGAEVRELSTRKDGELDPAKALQAALYALNLPQAQAATVVVYDPSNWRRVREYPLELAALEPAVRALEHALYDALRVGELPSRICAHPEDERGAYCPFRGVCFEGWERPEPRDASFALAGELGAMRLALDKRAVAREAVKAAEAEVEALTRQLTSLEPGTWYDAGEGYELRRRKVAGRRTADLSALEAAGHELPEGYVRQGEPYAVWDKPRLAPVEFGP